MRVMVAASDQTMQSGEKSNNAHLPEKIGKSLVSASLPSDVLVTLIQAYEAKHFPMETPDPVEAIKFVMRRRGLNVQDRTPVFRRTNRAYEVLNRTRPLSLAMIRKLHAEFGIPAAVLIA